MKRAFDDRNKQELNNAAVDDDSSVSLRMKMACTTTNTTTTTENTILKRSDGDDDTSSPSTRNQKQLEHEVCIQLAQAAAKKRHHEDGNNNNNSNQRTACINCVEKNAELLLSHYGGLLEQLLADPETMETYFRNTKNETNHPFLMKEELVNNIRQTAREKGYTLDARISDTILFNSIRRFYNTQLRYAEDRLTNVTKNHAHDDEIISILQRLENQKFVDHEEENPENKSADENNNVTPRASNKSTFGSCWGANHNTSTTTGSPTVTTTATSVEPTTPQMNVEPSPSRKRCVVDMDMKACPLPAPRLNEKITSARSPEDARNIKRSKTSHNNNNENTTIRSSSSSSDNATNPHHQVKHPRRNESSSPSSSLNSNDDSDKDTSWKASATPPREGSCEFQVSERFREITLTEEVMEVVDAARDDDMVTLLTFVRSRLAEGWYRSAIKFCHDTLQRLYQDACSVASQPSGRNNMLLKSYRETIAGVWCMYARFLHEIGSWKQNDKSAAAVTTAVKGNQRSLSALSQSATNDWRDYALATLASVTRCPLVGNHQDIPVAMARILVPVRDGNDSCCHPSADDVSDALAACKDGVRRCQGKCGNSSEPQDYCPILLNEMDFHRMARYEIGPTAMNQDHVSVSELQASFEAVMKLPLLLEPTPEKYYLRDGRAGVSLILAEMSRLDNLASKNHHHHQQLLPLNRKAPARSASASSSPLALGDVMDTDSTVSSSSSISSTKSSPRRQLFDNDDSEKVCTSCSRRFSVMEQEVCLNYLCFECQDHCNAEGNLA